MNQDTYTAKQPGFTTNHAMAIFQPLPYKYNQDASAFVQSNLENAHPSGKKIQLNISEESETIDLESWLKVSASTFEFWDNDLDVEYERL